MSGQVIAIIGLAICAALCGVGSAIGLFKTGSAAAGVLTEDAKKFSKVMVLVLLPASQGICGFVMAIFIQLFTISVFVSPPENSDLYSGNVLKNFSVPTRKSSKD